MPALILASQMIAVRKEIAIREHVLWCPHCLCCTIYVPPGLGSPCPSLYLFDFTLMFWYIYKCNCAY
jgi:hypothetical protein